MKANKLKQKLPSWMIFLGLALILSGCQSTLDPGTISTAFVSTYPVVNATPPGLIEITIPELKHQPTSTPTPDPTPTAAAHPEILPAVDLHFTNDHYHHPQNYFSFPLPEGWRLISENTDSALFEDLKNSLRVDFQVINTGHSLDNISYTHLISARDENTFGSYPQYRWLQRRSNREDGTVLTEKQAVIDSKMIVIISFYKKSAESILMMDFWVSKEKAPQYLETTTHFFNQVVLDPEEISSLDIYAKRELFHGPEGLFSIEVPLEWRQEKVATDDVLGFTFFSPDEQAMVQVVLYESDPPISATDAGIITLDMIKNYYAEDSIVQGDHYEPQAKERLIWFSPTEKCQGSSTFTLRGSTYLLLTVKYSENYRLSYAILLEKIRNTYDVPE